VPHISLVFREMWDTTNLNELCLLGRKIRRPKAVLSRRFLVEPGLYSPLATSHITLVLKKEESRETAAVNEALSCRPVLGLQNSL
jgi:hypothetical protein